MTFLLFMIVLAGGLTSTFFGCGTLVAAAAYISKGQVPEAAARTIKASLYFGLGTLLNIGSVFILIEYIVQS